jgi:hypothetical protein
MSQFKYILPSGAEFIVNGPGGATQTEADRIFYEQVAAGALIGYEPGQTLTSTATRLTKFELSRLDRGTAGVDSNPILALSQGLPTSSLTFGLQSILATIQALPIPVGVPSLVNIPLSNPITEADIVLIRGDDFAPLAITGNGITALNEYQVQKLLAQIAALVDQESDQISQNKGIGRFGFTAYALEEAGYVKPGTSLRFFATNPEDFISVMSSPSVWTGKNGVYSLDDVLDDAGLQNRMQAQLMQQGYEELLSNGTINTVTKPGISISSGQVYTNSGLQSISFLNTANLLGINTGSLAGITQNAFTPGTVLNRLLTSDNINLATIGSGAVNSLNSGLNNLGNLANANFTAVATQLTNQITGGVGALVTNASKFGTQATALWARASNLEGLANIAGAGFTRFGTNLAGSITSSVNNITTNLTNLVPGSFNNLSSSLNTFGKAGSFATNFANPLGNLNNLSGAVTGQLGALQGAVTGQLGALQGAVTGQLGALQGALTGQLGALSGQLSGVFGSLGNFANIGAVGDLFGGGGDLVSGTAVAGGFNNTVNRNTLDAAFARIVGNNKVPLPTYQYPSLSVLAQRLDIQQAANFLRTSQGSSGATFGQTVTI